jgi:hypothetical protein
MSLFARRMAAMMINPENNDGSSGGGRNSDTGYFTGTNSLQIILKCTHPHLISTLYLAFIDVQKLEMESTISFMAVKDLKNLHFR